MLRLRLWPERSQGDDAANGWRTGLLITSRLFKVIDPNDRNTVPLFGDGAAATLLRAAGLAALASSPSGRMAVARKTSLSGLAAVAPLILPVPAPTRCT